MKHTVFAELDVPIDDSAHTKSLSVTVCRSDPSFRPQRDPQIFVKVISCLKLICFAMVILLIGGQEVNAEIDLKKVRVGFFQFDGYHMRSALQENGEYHRSGYGYDVLQMMLPYTNWEYEYVGYEKGWSAMLPMLEKGEIDILTSTVKIPEKEKKFDFSSRPIGYSSVIMTVKAGNTRFMPRDYPNWNGMKVGVLQDNSKNSNFVRFAAEKKFTYQEIIFTQIEAMHEALQKGEIDAIVTGSLRRLQNEWLYEELDVKPYYIIVKKGNKELLNEINSALEKLEMKHPGFASELQVKYYDRSSSSSNEIPFSLEERAWQDKCRANNRQFHVLVNPDRFPFSYFENGEFKGGMKTLFDVIKERSKLDLVVVSCKDRHEYRKRLLRRECELILDMRQDFSIAEQRGYILTPTYLVALISRVSQKKNYGELKSCAVVENSNMAEIMQNYLPKECQRHTYPSLQSVIDAVKNGRVQSGFVFSQTAESIVLNDRSGLLTLQPTGHAVHFAIGARKDLDRHLVNILTKAVQSLSENEVQQARETGDLNRWHKSTIRDIVTEYPLTVLCSLIGLALILGSALIIVRFYYHRAKNAAAALAKNSRMWHLLVNSLPIHIFAKEGENDFRFIFNNKARTNFFGLDSEQMDYSTDFDFLPREMAIKRREVARKLCAAGSGQDECIMNVKDKNGRIHHLYSLLVPFIDSDGTKLLLGCSVDQTELEDARKQANENAERFHKTLISIGDAVLTTDSRGKITLLNPVAEKMLGVTLDECLGKKHSEYFQIVNYQDSSKLTSPVDRCLAEGKITTLANHTDLITANGTRYHIADSAAPILDADGTISGAILVFRDETQEYELRDKLQKNAAQLQEALAQAQKASNSKGIFLSQMSHEIRTPLSAIIGYMNIALNYNTDFDRIQDCLKKGLDASTHLLTIINDILDISSIERGKIKIAEEDFDFKHLLTGLVSMFYDQAEARGIRFELILQDLTEEWLIGDSLRVNQILLNLLSNAIKFTPMGGNVTLTVKQLGVVRNRVQLMFQVSDTGCGMSKEFLSRVFEPFEQQDASTTRIFGGTGLGLSITKNLVSLMEGTLEIKSLENVGTTFTVNISFEKSVKTLTVGDVDFSHLRALVVDDKEEDREYIKMVLNKCGVKCDVVDSGETAIRQILRRMDSRHPYDLCLLDLRLSGMSGLEAARQIRQQENVSKLPIILVTAYDVSAIAVEVQDAGVNKIIQKPLFQSTFFDFLMNTYYQQNEKKDLHEVKDALTGKNILLVEDNQMNMDISTQYLERTGIKITPAWNGKEAIEIFTNSKPGTFQAILMDVQMPVMNGYTAAEHIRASNHPEAKSVLIIAMTANAFNEDIVKALKSGMNDHVSKPVDYERLFAILSKHTYKEG